MPTRGTRRAGGSSHRKYKTMLRQWRRRNRKHFWAVGVGFGAVAIAANVAAADHGRAQWGAGVLTGVLMTMFLAARQEPPAHIEQWEIGAWGEQRTGKQLRKLDRHHWHVLNDLPGTRGNFDHVVIGPPGVFLLDTKNWHGELTIADDVATLRRLEDPDLASVFDRLPARMRSLAANLQDRYRELGLRPGWVTPIVVVWAKFPEQCAGSDKLMYVHGDEIVTWLQAQPSRLRADQVRQLENALRPAVATTSWLRRSRLGGAWL